MAFLLLFCSASQLFGCPVRASTSRRTNLNASLATSICRSRAHAGAVIHCNSRHQARGIWVRLGITPASILLLSLLFEPLSRSISGAAPCSVVLELGWQMLAVAGSCWADAGQQAQQALQMSPASPALARLSARCQPDKFQMSAQITPDARQINSRCSPDNLHAACAARFGTAGGHGYWSAPARYALY